MAEKYQDEIVPGLRKLTDSRVEVVRCKDCKHWHEKTGWCNQHSHFWDARGCFCHPWESRDWKMFNADDYCSYGERRADNVAD